MVLLAHLTAISVLPSSYYGLQCVAHIKRPAVELLPLTNEGVLPYIQHEDPSVRLAAAMTLIDIITPVARFLHERRERAAKVGWVGWA